MSSLIETAWVMSILDDPDPELVEHIGGLKDQAAVKKLCVWVIHKIIDQMGDLSGPRWDWRCKRPILPLR
jgi:hypothetical protein